MALIHSVHQIIPKTPGLKHINPETPGLRSTQGRDRTVEGAKRLDPIDDHHDR